MNKEKKLLKNTLIFSIGKICTQIATFLLLPLYTSVLTTKEYGIVDFITTISSLFLPIITLQIESAVFRELIDYRKEEKQKKEIISTGLITVCLQCAFYIIIMIFIYDYINSQYKIFYITNIVVYIILSILQQITRGLGENKKYAIGSFLSALFTIIFNIIFITIFRLGAYGMLIGICMGQIIGILYYIISIRIFKYLGISGLNKGKLKQFLGYSLPLVPNALSWWIFSASDRLIVTIFLGIDKNGILAASLKFSTIFVSIYAIMNMSWTESLSVNIEDKDFAKFFNKTFTMILNIFIILGIFMVCVMPIVYNIFIGKNFREGYNLVPISILSCLLNVYVGLISSIYVAKKDSKSIALTSVWAAAVNIIVHVSLIRVIGLYAAVLSTLIAYLIMAIYRQIDLNKKYIRFEINLKQLIITLFMLTSVIFSYYTKIYIINVVIFFILIYICVKNAKKYIKPILKMIKNKF